MRPLLAAAAVALLSLAPFGCSSKPADQDPLINAPTIRPLAERSSQVIIESVPLGRTPWDGFTLPFVSPDGHTVAVTVGRPPTKKVLTAGPGAQPPDDSAIELFELSAFGERGRSLGMVPTSAILGRASDDTGFFVESTQSDGSRWIGRYAWTGGKVDWLVTDDRVNAFAVPGPDGAMAWCSRRVDRREFDLIVTTGDGEWTTAPEDDELEDPYVPPVAGQAVVMGERPGRASWLFPTFGVSSRDLVCLRLQDGFLDAVWLDLAEDRMKIRATLRLPDHADEYLAWQCAATAPIDAARTRGEFLFIHPQHGCLVLWNPRENLVTELGPGVIAAASDGTGGFVVSDGKTLAYRDPLGSRRKLAVGLLIPRKVLPGGREMIVANPRGEDQMQYDVVQVRPAPPSAAAARSPAAAGE